MKKYFIIGTSIIFFIMITFFIWQEIDNDKKYSEIFIEGRIIKVEVVEDFEKMTQGLGGRDHLCSDCGMLFDFKKRGQRSFWMKNMRFPLDILWIDGDQVVSISSNISPDYSGILNPPVLADKVIEVNKGLVESYGIKIGSKVIFY